MTTPILISVDVRTKKKLFYTNETLYGIRIIGCFVFFDRIFQIFFCYCFSSCEFWEISNQHTLKTFDREKLENGNIFKIETSKERKLKKSTKQKLDLFSRNKHTLDISDQDKPEISNKHKLEIYKNFD